MLPLEGAWKPAAKHFSHPLCQMHLRELKKKKYTLPLAQDNLKGGACWRGSSEEPHQGEPYSQVGHFPA